MCCSSDGAEKTGGVPARTLDCVGLYCPEPLFRTRLEMDEIAPGETLEVLADDPAAEEDLARFAEKNGHRLLAARWENGILRVLIMKKTAR